MYVYVEEHVGIFASSINESQDSSYEGHFLYK